MENQKTVAAVWDWIMAMAGCWVLLCFTVHLQSQAYSGLCVQFCQKQRGIFTGHKQVHPGPVSWTEHRMLISPAVYVKTKEKAGLWSAWSDTTVSSAGIFPVHGTIQTMWAEGKVLGTIWNNKIITKHYFLYWDQGVKPHCHLSPLALSHKRLRSPSQLQLDGRLFRVTLSGSRWSHLAQNL